MEINVLLSAPIRPVFIECMSCQLWHSNGDINDIGSTPVGCIS